MLYFHSFLISQKIMSDLGDVIDGRLHAAQLRRLDVQQLQHVVGQSVDLIRHAGQRLGGVGFCLLQGFLLILSLRTDREKMLNVSNVLI